MLLPCSKQKGKPIFKYDDKKTESDQETCCNCGRGGLLTKLMIYDIFAFAAGVGVYFLTLYSNEDLNYVESVSYIYLA